MVAAAAVGGDSSDHNPALQRGAVSSTRQPHPAQPADLAHPPLGEPVGGDGRRYAVGGGELEDPQRGVVDAGGALLRAVEREALELVGDLDQPAGVDAVVGGVEDAALLER